MFLIRYYLLFVANISVFSVANKGKYSHFIHSVLLHETYRVLYDTWYYLANVVYHKQCLPTRE